MLKFNLKNKSFLLFAGFDAGKKIFQTVEPRLLRLIFDVQNLAQVFDAVGNIADGFGQERAGGVGVAAALKFFRDFERLAVAAAKARENGVAAPEQR